MARVTVEDCSDKVVNRFELVALATQRAKDITSGVPITVSRNNDKDAVIALREIALGHIKIDVLREELIKRLQNHHKVDKIDDDQPHTEESIEDFDYIATGSDLHISEDHSDLDLNSDQMFDDNIADEDDGKRF